MTTRVPTIDPAIIPARSHSEQLVKDFCRRADVSYRPCGFNVHEVSEILCGMEYDVNADGLKRLVARGLVDLPPSGKWAAVAVHRAAAVLEAQRKWQPESKIHDAKKSQAQMLVEQHGDENLLADVQAWTLRELLHFLVEADQRQLREGFLTAVFAKLKTKEIDPDE